MRIALIGPAHPYRGGIADFNHALATALEKDGHECRIYTFSLQYPGFLFPGKTQYAEGKSPVGTEIIRCINSVNPFSWLRAAIKIKSYRPELILTHYWMPFMAPALGTTLRFAGNKKIKKIGILHNIIPHEKFPASKLFNKYFLKACHGYLSMSKAVLKDLEKFVKNQNKLFTPHPIYDHFGPIIQKDKAKEKLGLDKAQKYLLFFGIIRKYKGLDLLIDAMANLKQQHPDLKALIAGEFYENKSNYINKIKENQLEEQFILTDSFVAAKDVKYYFSAADIIVQPYRTATQSGVTQIAYHFERPMLVTNVGGLSEIIPHKKVGYVCDTDPKLIAEAIHDYYAHGREAEFVKGVLEEKKKYSWEVLVRRLMKLQAGIKAD